jgi:putative Mn2+ efflux pump MntP
MLWEGLFAAAERERPARHSFLLLLATALGTSVDALAVGATLAFLDREIWTVALAIGLTTFGLATLGIMVGHAAGARVGRVAEVIGGVMLIGIGTAILVEHLGQAPPA